MLKPVIKYPSPQGVNRGHRPGRTAPRHSETVGSSSGIRLVSKLVAASLCILSAFLFFGSLIDNHNLYGLFNAIILFILGVSLWFLSGHDRHVIEHLESRLRKRL